MGRKGFTPEESQRGAKASVSSLNRHKFTQEECRRGNKKHPNQHRFTAEERRRGGSNFDPALRIANGRKSFDILAERMGKDGAVAFLKAKERKGTNRA